MKNFLAMTTLILLAGSFAEANQNSSAIKKGSKPIKIVNTQSAESVAGPSEIFTGKVQVTTVLTPDDSASISCASVAFEAGARTAWHTHPKGQLLVVTSGSGLIQEAGQPIGQIKVGDVIWTPPDVKHWHGAAPKSAMAHTATQEIVNGTPVRWMEKVTDSEYNAK